MLNFNWKNQTRVIVLGFSVLTLILVLGYRSLPSDNNASDTETDTLISQNSVPGKVFVKDINKIDDTINPKTIEEIENKLYEHAGRMDPGLYTGTIREESYTKTTSADNLTVQDFTVDVEPINSAYKVTLFGSKPSGIVRVVCAPQDEQTNSGSCEGAYHP